jgi:hypothetical protein
MSVSGIILGVMFLAGAVLTHEGLRKRDVYERETPLKDVIVFGAAGYGALLFVSLFLACIPTYSSSGLFVFVPPSGWVGAKTLVALFCWSIPFAWEFGNAQYQEVVRKFAIAALCLGAATSFFASSPMDQNSEDSIKVFHSVVLPVSPPHRERKRTADRRPQDSVGPFGMPSPI